jgi:hypothetical protein
MSTESIAVPGRSGVDWQRAEFVLTGLGFLALPIRITTIYDGLPAHPLFVHVPVVLIPTTIVAAVVFVFKREWFVRYGIALAVVSIVAMSSIFLTMPTGFGIVDRLLAPKPVPTGLCVVLVLLSLGAGYMCFRTGDLGAKAVWQGRLQAAHGGGPGGSRLVPGGTRLFGPAGGSGP